MQQFRIALCQILPIHDKAQNVHRAYSMVAEAAGNGASLIAFPEMFYYPYELPKLARICGDENAILDGFKQLARKLGVCICCGSMACSDCGACYNRAFLVGSDGNDLLAYSKCHLFDAQIGDLCIRESDVFTPGNDVPTAETVLGKIGMLICYDIRFPEMAREIALQGAQMLLLPAAFNSVTGAAHWKCFMQTRATENQLFLAAISPARDKTPGNGFVAYGHSMVVSPWGDILAEAGEDETIIYADINPELLEKARIQLPLLQHRRDMLYNSFKAGGKTTV